MYIDDFILLMIGEGELKPESEAFCLVYDLFNYVRFLGIRSDIERIYQAMDICILPSLFEGFPMVGIESISAGLPLLLSDRITHELQFGSHVTYLPLESEKWINILLNKPVNPERETGAQESRANGFDINDTIHILEKAYNEASNKLH